MFVGGSGFASTICFEVPTMLKMIQTHMMKKRVQARAAEPRQTNRISPEDIQRKLAQYQPSDERANFTGPKLDSREFEKTS